MLYVLKLFHFLPANPRWFSGQRSVVLLVFCDTPFKIDQNKIQNRSIDKVQNLENERRYIYTQRPSPRFMSEEFFIYEISEEMFYPKLQRFVWRRHAGAHLDELQHGGRKPTETSVTEFCYKSVNSFFEKLINIKVILLLIHELFRQQNFLKSLEIQAYSITKPRTLLKRKFV